MKIEVSLREDLVDSLQYLPKTGIDYQVVNMKLKDGRVLEDVLVYDSSVAVLDDSQYTSEIEEILGY